MADPAREAHALAVAAADNVYQNTITPTSTAAQVKAARIAYYQSVLASGRANGVKTGARQALIALGQPDGTGQAGD